MLYNGLWVYNIILSIKTILTQILYLGDEVVAKVKTVELLQRLQVLNLLDKVLMEEETAQARLVLKVFNLVYAVTFQPQALEACVLFKTLDLVDTLNEDFDFLTLPGDTGPYADSATTDHPIH